MREHLACMRAPSRGPAPPALRLPGLGESASDEFNLSQEKFEKGIIKKEKIEPLGHK